MYDTLMSPTDVYYFQTHIDIKVHLIWISTSPLKIKLMTVFKGLLFSGRTILHPIREQWGTQVYNICHANVVQQNTQEALILFCIKFNGFQEETKV